MSRLRVLQVNKLYSPHIGGIEKIVQNIAEGLKDKLDIKVLVCQEKGRGANEVINGVEVIRSGSLGLYASMPLSPGFPLLLNRLSRDRDILHFHMPFPLGDLSYLFMKPKNKKIVVSWHSDIIRQQFWLKYYRSFLYKFLNLADKILVAAPANIEFSPFLKEFREKCMVIPYGIDDSPFQSKDMPEKIENIRNQYGGGPLLLFVGRLVYYKGLEYLIRAMGQVNARLLVIGHGPLLEQHKALVHKTGLEKRVFFLGEIDQEDMPLYYEACDIFVLPSSANSEAFGLVQLEAMACARPVINTLLPTGITFASLDRQTGITVPPLNSGALANAIKELLADEGLRKEYGYNARKRFQHYFTRDKMLNNILRLYEGLF
ncbi:glycosyltransferase [Candidatus Contubernalis alkaliaceticus]|uniref:glycosyltransferase n=1 Tax=Candidatus Contubernalis alkaliaceticus TaxID=338645 RepID=UPI001F4C379A|nr:glycosyltransferase [Candidatus Contubernalis alkalaceticus]UNC93603.1 glycosyltransferase [Candidatus Contubernalis alkalaceticus]